jgi:hypothetical protein
MQKYHQHFSEIDNIYWTDYFLKEFIPKYKFFEKTSDTGSSYIEYHKDFVKEPEILKLSALLTSKVKFPPIEYFVIFRHVDIDQLIHADGGAVLRNSSFNLALTGYESTIMRFYEMKNHDTKPKISNATNNANYYNKENLVNAGEFFGSNEWVLVNSAVPHNVVNIDANKPRLTVCIRFIGNPTFEDLIKNSK